MLLKRTFDKETDDMDKTQARDPAAVLREMVIGTAYYPWLLYTYPSPPD